MGRETVREVRYPDGSYAIARKQDAWTWLVTANVNDDFITQVQGEVWLNDAGFRGRQWESKVDGQQYPTLKAATSGVMDAARDRSKSAEFLRTLGTIAPDMKYGEDDENLFEVTISVIVGIGPSRPMIDSVLKEVLLENALARVAQESPKTFVESPCFEVEFLEAVKI